MHDLDALILQMRHTLLRMPPDERSAACALLKNALRDIDREQEPSAPSEIEAAQDIFEASVDEGGDKPASAEIHKCQPKT